MTTEAWPLPSAPEVSAISAEWTLRLRVGSLLGQLGTVGFVVLVLGIALPLGPLLLVMGLGLLSNVAAFAYLRSLQLGSSRLPPGRIPAWLLPLLLALDVLELTAMLYFSGGPMNPFSFMYLVLIALATVVATPSVTWGLVALSVACSGVLFLWHRPLDWHVVGGNPMRIHLYGMWVAFSVAAGFIVYFLLRIRRALGLREAELEAARSLAARRDKLASLATLAAGAAHELATPLSTIAVAAKELERQLARPDADGRPVGAALEDVRLIRAQVGRCRGVLDQLAREAGDSGGEELAPVTAARLLATTLDALPKEAQARVQAAITGRDADDAPLPLPLESLAQALRGIVRNALEAAAAPAVVGVRLALASDALLIEVRDEGAGMSEQVLRRIGEPFFTTKPPGQGMGLGVFLCQAVVESLGGQLTFRSPPGQGTVAAIRLPRLGPRPAARQAA